MFSRRGAKEQRRKDSYSFLIVSSLQLGVKFSYDAKHTSVERSVANVDAMKNRS
jgi:hypothetical protein